MQDLIENRQKWLMCEGNLHIEVQGGRATVTSRNWLEAQFSECKHNLVRVSTMTWMVGIIIPHSDNYKLDTFYQCINLVCLSLRSRRGLFGGRTSENAAQAQPRKVCSGSDQRAAAEADAIGEQQLHDWGGRIWDQQLTWTRWDQGDYAEADEIREQQ